MNFEKHQVRCDGCGMNPIVGICYTALVENFDFCENCEATKNYEFPLIKLKNPKQREFAIDTKSKIRVDDKIFIDNCLPEIPKNFDVYWYKVDQIFRKTFNNSEDSEKHFEKIKNKYAKLIIFDG